MPRPIYQDGRLLRTTDYIDEQQHHVSQLRRHERTHHTWGIASGLNIVATDGQMIVEAGVAVDGYGRAVALQSPRPLDLRAFDVSGTSDVDVWIQYAIETTSSGEFLGRTGDSAVVELRRAGEINAQETPPPDVVAERVASAIDGARPAWPLLLGTIRRNLQKPNDPAIIDTSGRRYIGLVGASITAPGEAQPWMELNDTVVKVGWRSDNEHTAPLSVDGDTVSVDGTLNVAGTVTVNGGSLEFGNAAASVPIGQDWSISRQNDGMTDQLLIEFPSFHGREGRVVIGTWENDKFLPRVAIDANGTMTVAGNLRVEGAVTARSVREAVLTDDAKAYLAGLRNLGLLSLFTAQPGPGPE
jgi:phage baseplate assembly protein gpV